MRRHVSKDNNLLTYLLACFLVSVGEWRHGGREDCDGHVDATVWCSRDPRQRHRSTSSPASGEISL